MHYTSLVYNLLGAGFWSITAALPRGSAGTRAPVGVPEGIPDVTFIARQVTAADGIQPQAERNRLNGYIQGAQRFHTLYGLNPVMISSLDDVLTHFQARTTPIDRIRIVSHGNNAFVFLPVFPGGRWNFGMQETWLEALNTSDEAGLRFLFTNNATTTPVLVNVVTDITDGIRARNAAVLTALGVPATGPTGALLEFFEVVNDLYQVANGTVFSNNAMLTATSKATLTTSLTLIEAAVRRRMPTTVAPAALDAFKAAVLGASLVDLGFLGPPLNLAVSVVADVQAALAVPAAARVEADLRTAIAGGAAEPVLGVDYHRGMIGALGALQAGVLNLGGGQAYDDNDPGLRAFAVVAVDLHHLRNGVITVDNRPSTPQERAVVRDGLVAIANVISRDRIQPGVGNTITAGRLTAFRNAIENRPLAESGLTGWQEIVPAQLVELAATNTAMQGGFRTRLDHFGTLMRPTDATVVDIRGCLVGQAPDFLDAVRTLLGDATNQPRVTAPDWFQSFPSGFRRGGFNPTQFAAIDTFVASGAGPLAGTDVDDAATTWRGLIDFDPHFDFITALFGAAASKREFASLRWRAWRTPTMTTGIPILRMEAARLDTIDTLSLGDVIERLRSIFEIPAASAPNAAERGRLTALQPHVRTFLVTSELLAGAAPSQPQLDQALADLTAVATGASAVVAPTTPLTPPAAPATLPALQAFATGIGTHLDSILDPRLNPFFAAVRAVAGHANARIRYLYGVALPLLVQSAANEMDFVVSAFAPTSAMTGNAFRSWMRIQWTGTAAQATAMNAVIGALPLTTDAQFGAASQVSMLSESDPLPGQASDAAIGPMPRFDTHIVKRPP